MNVEWDAGLPSFDSLEAFHADDPARARSGERDFGVYWYEAEQGWSPSWRVSAIKDTGEIYAIRLRADAPRAPGRVVVLGRVDAGDYVRAEAMLAGWENVVGAADSLRWAVAATAAARDTHVDPRRLGGAISGPGGPFDQDAVVIDTRNAVILEGVEVAVVGPIRQGVLDPKPITALVLRGRINKTTERVQALYLLNEDGAAGIVTELVDVAARAGWGHDFVDRVVARLAAMPDGPRA